MISTRREFVKQTAAASALLAHSGVFAQHEGYIRLQRQLKTAADDLQFPGFVAGVVKEGRLVLVQMEGFADIEAKAPMQAESIFNVASLTKTFFAVMLMQYQKALSKILRATRPLSMRMFCCLWNTTTR